MNCVYMPRTDCGVNGLYDEIMPHAVTSCLLEHLGHVLEMVSLKCLEGHTLRPMMVLPKT
jgi:hypothetical protein